MKKIQQKKQSVSLYFKISLPIIAISFLLFLFALLPVFFPTRVIGFIETSTQNQVEYVKDYIFSVKIEENPSIREMVILQKDKNNYIMGESLQRTTLIVDTDSFYWDRFYKFDNLFMKGPYKEMFVKIEDTEKPDATYTHSAPKSYLNEILLGKVFSQDKGFICFSAVDTRLININLRQPTFYNKITLDYSLQIEEKLATELFDVVYRNIIDSERFESFFIEDYLLAKHIEKESVVKPFKQTIKDLFNDITIKELNIYVSLNLKHTKSILYEFESFISMGKASYPATIKFEEFIEFMPSGYSPEEESNLWDVDEK